MSLLTIRRQVVRIAIKSADAAGEFNGLHGRIREPPIDNSFPSSAWECPFETLCVSLSLGVHRITARQSLADVRSQAEPGNEDGYATLAKTLATFTERADHAGITLPANAVPAPIAAPHHRQLIGTRNRGKNAI